MVASLARRLKAKASERRAVMQADGGHANQGRVASILASLDHRSQGTWGA
jgi:hypothetical protein